MLISKIDADVKINVIKDYLFRPVRHKGQSPPQAKWTTTAKKTDSCPEYRISGLFVFFFTAAPAFDDIDFGNQRI